MNDLRKPSAREQDLFFGQAVKTVRERQEKTQEAIASEMKLKGFDFVHTTIYKIETGRRGVSVQEAAALAEVLDVDLNHLLNFNPDSQVEVVATIMKAASFNLDQLTLLHSQLNLMLGFGADLEKQLKRFEELYGNQDVYNNKNPRQLWGALTFEGNHALHEVDEYLEGFKGSYEWFTEGEK